MRESVLRHSLSGHVQPFFTTMKVDSSKLCLHYCLFILKGGSFASLSTCNYDRDSYQGLEVHAAKLTLKNEFPKRLTCI